MFQGSLVRIAVVVAAHGPAGSTQSRESYSRDSPAAFTIPTQLHRPKRMETSDVSPRQYEVLLLVATVMLPPFQTYRPATRRCFPTLASSSGNNCSNNSSCSLRISFFE